MTSQSENSCQVNPATQPCKYTNTHSTLNMWGLLPYRVPLEKVLTITFKVEMEVSVMHSREKRKTHTSLIHNTNQHPLAHTHTTCMKHTCTSTHHSKHMKVNCNTMHGIIPYYVECNVQSQLLSPNVCELDLPLANNESQF